jgi:peptidyl-tRNA hydrolase
MKLYLVVRKDLAGPGAMAAQLCHALRQFSAEHPDVDSLWFERSNTLVLLEVSDEATLVDLARQARDRGVPAAMFREPDLGDVPTALALGPDARHLVRRLPLAFG